MTAVIDASFAVDLLTAPVADWQYGWVIEATEAGLTAPAIFWFEVGNALRGLMLRQLISPAFRSAAFDRLRAMTIDVEARPHDIGRIVALSDRHQLTVYDAAYLDLALRTEVTLATRDKALIAAARRAGVGLMGSAGQP